MALEVLTSIVMLLAVGFGASIISRHLKLPDILLLIFSGVLLQYLSVKGVAIIDFSNEFITVVALFALAMIVFDSSCKLKFREFSRSFDAIKLMMIFTVLCLVFFSIAAMYYLPFQEAVLLSALLVGSSADIALSMFTTKVRIVEILKLESIFNTPVTVILPFFVLEILKYPGLEVVISQITPFLTKLVVGVGSGVVVGIIMLALLEKYHDSDYVPLGIIVGVLLAFVISENLKGDGVIAMTALGVLFGNYAKKISTEFESFFAKTLYVFVYVLLGYGITLGYGARFILSAIILYLAYTGIRFLAVSVSLSKFSLKEKVFASLSFPKGIASAIVILSLSVLGFSKTFVDIGIVMIGISIIVSTIVAKMQFFVKSSQ